MQALQENRRGSSLAKTQSQLWFKICAQLKPMITVNTKGEGSSGQYYSMLLAFGGKWQKESFIVQCNRSIFLLFCTVHGVLKTRIWEWVAISSSGKQFWTVLSELFTVTWLSWMGLFSMTHSFIELCKPLHHNKAVIQEGRKGKIYPSECRVKENSKERQGGLLK